MARFAVSGNYLYLVDHSSVKVVSTAEGKFQQLHEEPISFGMETIFANGDYLYLGANDAMYIYSIATPSKPQFVFRYQHIVSCDPVVVQGDRAYVTMRSGSFCNRGTNALEIIDISDPYAPVLIRIETSAGHGAGTPISKLIDESSDRLAFLAHFLDVPTPTLNAEDGAD